MCQYAGVGAYHSDQVGVSSLFLPYEPQVSKSDSKAWGQEPLLTGTSFQALSFLCLFLCMFWPKQINTNCHKLKISQKSINRWTDKRVIKKKSLDTFPERTGRVRNVAGGPKVEKHSSVPGTAQRTAMQLGKRRNCCQSSSTLASSDTGVGGHAGAYLCDIEKQPLLTHDETLGKELSGGAGWDQTAKISTNSLDIARVT